MRFSGILCSARPVVASLSHPPFMMACMTAQLTLISTDPTGDDSQVAQSFQAGARPTASRGRAAAATASPGLGPSARVADRRPPRPEPPAPVEVVRSKIAEAREILEASRKRALERDERRQVVVVPAPVRRQRPGRAA